MNIAAALRRLRLKPREVAIPKPDPWQLWAGGSLCWHRPRRTRDDLAAIRMLVFSLLACGLCFAGGIGWTITVAGGK